MIVCPGPQGYGRPSIGSVSPGRGPYITIHYTHWRNKRPSNKNNLTFLKLMLFLWRARPRNISRPYPRIPPPTVTNIFIKVECKCVTYSIVSSEKQERERDLQGHYKFCKPTLWRKVLRAQLALSSSWSIWIKSRYLVSISIMKKRARDASISLKLHIDKLQKEGIFRRRQQEIPGWSVLWSRGS